MLQGQNQTLQLILQLNYHSIRYKKYYDITAVFILCIIIWHEELTIQSQQFIITSDGFLQIIILINYHASISLLTVLTLIFYKAINTVDPEIFAAKNICRAEGKIIFTT